MGLDKLNWRFLKLWIKTYIASVLVLGIATGIVLLVIEYPWVGLFLVGPTHVLPDCYKLLPLAIFAFSLNFRLLY